MRLDSIINLVDSVSLGYKAWIDERTYAPMASKPRVKKDFYNYVENSVAFGIVPGTKPDQHKLAIRSWTEDGLKAPYVQNAISLAHGEVDAKVTGVIRAPRPFAQDEQFTMKERMRPLRAGFSIGNFAITAGTLGCFVKTWTGKVMILSNFHVLVGDHGKKGDAILQPGSYDGGRNPDDEIGALRNFVQVKQAGNIMDAAIASIHRKNRPSDFTVPYIGKLTDLIMNPEDVLDVQKTGRTTGHQKGKVTAINLRGVAVNYGPMGVCTFDNCIEIGTPGFSAGGDSGSLVVDKDNNPYGLLFAGSESHTILNPIGPVLKQFHVKIAR
ncbi:MAG: hypothetical protein ACOYLO_00350 [Ferruginibacter sp.]